MFKIDSQAKFATVCVFMFWLGIVFDRFVIR